MLKILVYKYKNKHYVYPLGCCQSHRINEDVFILGGEEEIFTINQGSSIIETPRQFMTELDNHGITEIIGLTIILDIHQKIKGKMSPSHTIN